MVYVRLMGIAVSGFVVIVFLRPWLSAISMKVLLFGRDVGLLWQIQVICKDSRIRNQCFFPEHMF